MKINVRCPDRRSSFVVGVNDLTKRNLTRIIGSTSLTDAKGKDHEQNTTVGWHAKGRFHSHFRWQAAELGRKRAAFCRLGNVSFEGVAGGPESHLRVADERMVRADH